MNLPYTQILLGITTMEYSLIKSADVNITVFDMPGEKVFDLSVKKEIPGSYESKLPSLSPGIYIVEMNVNEKRFFRKLITF